MRFFEIEQKNVCKTIFSLFLFKCTMFKILEKNWRVFLNLFWKMFWTYLMNIKKLRINKSTKLEKTSENQTNCFEYTKNSSKYTITTWKSPLLNFRLWNYINQFSNVEKFLISTFIFAKMYSIKLLLLYLLPKNQEKFFLMSKNLEERYNVCKFYWITKRARCSRHQLNKISQIEFSQSHLYKE